jgi:hypothetical protein
LTYSISLRAAGILMIGIGAVRAQFPPGQSPPASQSRPTGVQPSQIPRPAAPAAPPALSSGSPLTGSIPNGQATGSEMSLTIEDALARGLKYNLGVIQGDLDTRLERSNRLRALSQLLPELNIRPSVTEQQVNLASFGFSGFPGIPSVVGPFTVYDARAYMSAPVLDIPALRNFRAAALGINAAQQSYQTPSP